MENKLVSFISSGKAEVQRQVDEDLHWVDQTRRARACACVSGLVLCVFALAPIESRAGDGSGRISRSSKE